MADDRVRETGLQERNWPYLLGLAVGSQLLIFVGALGPVVVVLPALVALATWFSSSTRKFAIGALAAAIAGAVACGVYITIAQASIDQRGPVSFSHASSAAA